MPKRYPVCCQESRDGARVLRTRMKLEMEVEQAEQSRAEQKII